MQAQGQNPAELQTVCSERLSHLKTSALQEAIILIEVILSTSDFILYNSQVCRKKGSQPLFYYVNRYKYVKFSKLINTAVCNVSKI